MQLSLCISPLQRTCFWIFDCVTFGWAVWRKQTSLATSLKHTWSWKSCAGGNVTDISSIYQYDFKKLVGLTRSNRHINPIYFISLRNTWKWTPEKHVCQRKIRVFIIVNRSMKVLHVTAAQSFLCAGAFHTVFDPLSVKVLLLSVLIHTPCMWRKKKPQVRGAVDSTVTLCMSELKGAKYNTTDGWCSNTRWRRTECYKFCNFEQKESFHSTLLLL